MRFIHCNGFLHLTNRICLDCFCCIILKIILTINTIFRVRKHVSIVRRHSADWIYISIVRCTVQSKPPNRETIVNIITQTDMHHFYIWIVCELLTWKCFKCLFIFHLNLIKIWKFSMTNCKMHCVLLWDGIMSTHIVNID